MHLDRPRLLVRNLRRHDLHAVHQILDVDSWPGERTLAERARWLDWTLLDYEQRALAMQPPYGEYAIEARTGPAAGRVVGLVGLVPSLMPFGLLPSYFGRDAGRDADAGRGTEGPHSWNLPEVGLFWAVAAARRGQGYAADAARAMIGFGFSELRLRRIVATTEEDNPASAGVMRAAGMRIEHNRSGRPPYLQVVGIADNPGPMPDWSA